MTTARMGTYIALLRGINVVGRNSIAMAELRTVAEQIGWRDVQTYINSGNVIFSAMGTPAQLETQLERAIAERFDLSIPVIVRAGSAWPAYIEGNPFPEESERAGNLVQIALSKAAPRVAAVEELQARAANGERVARAGDALWVYYPFGIGRSKLTPALFDRVAGSPVTARNWRTVLKLQKLAQD